MLIVDKHCSDICCDEFLVLQIDRKSKQVKENFICIQYREQLAILNTENIKFVDEWQKLKAISVQFVWIFFHICWLSAENLNAYFPQVSVATYLRR